MSNSELTGSVSKTQTPETTPAPALFKVLTKAVPCGLAIDCIDCKLPAKLLAAVEV